MKDQWTSNHSCENYFSIKKQSSLQLDSNSLSKILKFKINLLISGLGH